LRPPTGFGPVKFVENNFALFRKTEVVQEYPFIGPKPLKSISIKPFSLNNFPHSFSK
jgi:hypothetical protein